METLYAFLALATFFFFRAGKRMWALGLFLLTVAVGWAVFVHHASDQLPLSF